MNVKPGDVAKIVGDDLGNRGAQVFVEALDTETPGKEVRWWVEAKQLKTHPSVWEPLQGLITQAPGKPSVAPTSDPRPTWSAPVFDGESYSAEDMF